MCTTLVVKLWINTVLCIAIYCSICDKKIIDHGSFGCVGSSECREVVNLTEYTYTKIPIVQWSL